MNSSVLTESANCSVHHLRLIVALGLYPQLVFKMTDLPVTELVHGLSRAL